MVVTTADSPVCVRVCVCVCVTERLCVWEEE